MKIGIIIFALIVGFLYFKARAIIKLTYRLGGIEALTLFRSQIQFKLNILVFNPSNTSVNVDYATVNLSLNTSYIGKCILEAPKRIKELGEDTVQIFISIGLLDLVQAIPDILSSVKSRKFTFKFRGIVGGEGVKADIDEPIYITIPKIRASLKTVKLTANEKYEFVPNSELQVLVAKQTYKLTA